MGSPWFSCLRIHHDLSVSMIRTDEHNAAHLLHCIHCFSNTLVYCLNRLDGGSFHACVAYHVRICKVYNHYVVIA